MIWSWREHNPAAAREEVRFSCRSFAAGALRAECIPS
jgi:hypothetical protein